MIITKKQRRLRRAVKTRAHIRDLGVARLTVHRTPRHIYAQVTDAMGAKVIAVASTVQEAVRQGRAVVAETDGRTAGGTHHLSAADANGMLVALTLTHGGSFGARVTVDGLGLILGHGMSRFDPRPRHPNAPGPGKRPLHNMCPTVVLRDGVPVLAVGARGGRRIPNALFEVLTGYVGRQAGLEKAVTAPRMHTEGEVLSEEHGPDGTSAQGAEVDADRAS